MSEAAPGSRRRIAGQGAWAIADQAAFATSNFVLNLLLARWMGPQEYGVFGVAFTVLLLVSLAQTALVIDPLVVFGAGRWRSNARAYVLHVFRSQLALAALGSVACAAAGVVAMLVQGGGAIGGALVTLTWVGPSVVVQWMLRRACYVHAHVSTAAAAGGLYLVLLIGLAFLARATIGLDTVTALGAMGVTSIVVAAFLAWRLAALLPTDSGSGDVPDGVAVRVAHWNFGRWILASHALGWVGTDVFYVVLAPLHGYAAVGSVRAAYNLVQPFFHVLTAVGTTAVVSFVGIVQAGRPLPILAWWASMTAVGVAYTAVVLPSSAFLMALLYGDGFAFDRSVAWLLALLPIPFATQAAFSAIVRALEQSRLLYVAHLASAVVALAVGVPLAWAFGAAGAAGGMVLSATTAAVATGLLLRRMRVSRA